jgi:calcium-dependent protein kinase
MAFIINFNDRFAELEELRQVFFALDTSKDGKLTKDEIKDGLISIMGDVKGNFEFYERLMVDLDKDCNGAIEYSEFITASIKKANLLTHDNLQAAFNIIDSDGSGKISIEELKASFDLTNDKEETLWK